jgi:tRNA pseudouridine13 synthase
MTDVSVSDRARERRFLTAAIPPVRASFREEPGDFEVDEVPLYPALGAGTHTYVLIEKRGISTMEAIRRIAARLGRRAGEIGYAGLKDARAVARQRISIEHLADDARAKIGDAHVRPLGFERHSNKLQPGHLRGNVFRILLRGADEADLGAARAALGMLAAEGVPNHFGRQRFGGVRPTTHRLGFALLRGEWQALLATLLGAPLAAESPRVREARTCFDRGDLAGALERFPPKFRAERAALAALLAGRGEERAAAAIPREERQLYANAAQSALFNDLLDERLDRGALGRLEAGEVAFIHAKGACFVVEDAAAEAPRAARFEISPAGPLFGPKLLAAKGEPAEREARALAASGLTLESFASRLAMAPRGARRPYRVPLENVSIRQELDALRLEFFLPAGSYATAIVSELMKRDVA